MHPTERRDDVLLWPRGVLFFGQLGEGERVAVYDFRRLGEKI